MVTVSPGRKRGSGSMNAQVWPLSNTTVIVWRRSSVICDTALLIEPVASAGWGSIWRRLRPKLASVPELAAAAGGAADPTAAAALPAGAWLAAAVDPAASMDATGAADVADWAGSGAVLAVGGSRLRGQGKRLITRELLFTRGNGMAAQQVIGIELRGGRRQREQHDRTGPQVKAGHE